MTTAPAALASEQSGELAPVLRLHAASRRMVEQTHAFEPVESAGAEARSTPDVTRLRLGAEARVFLVGQSPGVEEIRTGRPFVGRAGKFLDEALCRVGLSRQVVFITSVEKHRPPGNRRPTRLEVEACKSSLVRQIAIVDPRVVVLLGRVAEEALAGEPVLEGRRVLVTAHPAAAMRFPWLRRRFLRDLHTLRRMARRAS